MAQNLIINSTDTDGKKVQTTVTNINPDASDYQLKVFSQKLNALTTNTYKGTVRVDRDDITDAFDPDNPEFTVTPNNLSSWSKMEQYTFQLSYLGDARNVTFSGKKPKGAYLDLSADKKTVYIQPGEIGPDEGADELKEYALTLTLAAGSGFNAATAKITFGSGGKANDPDGFEDVND